MPSNREFILAIDIGSARVGVARAHLSARFPAPLTTLTDPETFIDDVLRLVEQEDARAVVAGLPRDMKGQETEQTRSAREFGRKLEERLSVPLYWTDEAVTSEKAEAELKRRGKPYQKADIDALAATYILDDFLRDHPEVANV